MLEIMWKIKSCGLLSVSSYSELPELHEDRHKSSQLQHEPQRSEHLLWWKWHWLTPEAAGSFLLFWMSFRQFLCVVIKVKRGFQYRTFQYSSTVPVCVVLWLCGGHPELTSDSGSEVLSQSGHDYNSWQRCCYSCSLSKPDTYITHNATLPLLGARLWCVMLGAAKVACSREEELQRSGHSFLTFTLVVFRPNQHWLKWHHLRTFIRHSSLWRHWWLHTTFKT